MNRIGRKRSWLAAAALAACGAVGLSAQNSSTREATRVIEVASIRPASYPSEDYFRGFTASSGICGIGARRPAISGNRVNLPKMSLCQLIAMAYTVQDFRISGIPAAMMKLDRSNFYDVQIKAEGDSTLTEDQARGLLRALIADRFHLRLHRDTKTFPVYELAIGKNGTKLREVPVYDNSQRTGVAMATYISFISEYLDGPIVDKTGLTGGHYRFQWDQTELRQELAQGLKPVPSIFHAVEEQLGLTLKPAKESMDVLVIDQAEPPSPN